MKRLLALLLSLVLMLGAAVPAYATGDGNFDGGGGGMGSGTSTNYWNPGMDGVRISVVNVDSHAVVGNTVDWSNQNPSTNMIHFGKVSKLSYNSGRALSPVVGGYVCVRPAQSLPRIISTGDYPASIAAIRSYFTDEQVIRAIAGYVGIDFDTLIAGDYKIVVEPIAYFVYGGAYYAMTATEAALYDQKVNGDLRSKMGSLTHKNLPLAIFLEEADLGYEDAEYHNAVFVGTDTDGVPRHAHKRSANSYGKAFRLNVEGSDPRYSFHYVGTDRSLYVFEAPIDMLSFITLYPENWQRHSYVACCGTSIQPVLQMLEQAPQLDTVLLCLDNDEAGNQASRRMQNQLEVRYSVERLIPENKDWNDDLTLSGENAQGLAMNEMR